MGSRKHKPPTGKLGRAVELLVELIEDGTKPVQTAQKYLRLLRIARSSAIKSMLGPARWKQLKEIVKHPDAAAVLAQASPSEVKNGKDDTGSSK